MRYVGRRDLLLVLENLGILMQAIGIAVLLPIIVALIYGEGNYIGFLLPSAVSLTLGTILNRYINVSAPVRLKHGMMVAGLAWLWAALIGSMVMMLVVNLDFLNAFFENMSGWTGSGLTIFADVEVLPKSILFLRSVEQWIGGLGIVIVVIGILIRPGTTASKLYKSEAREERIKPSIRNTIKTILWIYLIYTLSGVILYLLAGMPLFDAINNTMTNLATGGMSIKNDNIGFYDNNLIYLITMFLMIVGASSFLLHYKVFKGKFRNVINDIQFQTMLTLITIFSLLIIITRFLLPLDSIFHVISALTCTGSSIQTVPEMSEWAGYVKIVIMMGMIIGGAAGSTTGAVKLIRFITVIKGMYWEIMKIITPKGAIIRRTISGKTVDDAEIKEASVYISIYFLFIFISWLVLSAYGYDTLNALFEVFSAQGNVGLSMGITSAQMPTMPKLFLIFNMWLGRLEIIPVMILIRGFLEVFKRK